MINYKRALEIVEEIIENFKIENNRKYNEEYICELGMELYDCLEGIRKDSELQEICFRIPSYVKSSFHDAEAIYSNDPAANGLDEIILCYPGYKAILYYRIAHQFYLVGQKIFARIITEKAHSMTGIDIHPGANIGENFAIDHGTGIVIGETATIGNNVIIYQGVTLGALHINEREQVGKVRHPTIKDNVVIYANATILGGETVIGEGSVIGGNTFITKSVDPYSVIYYTK